MASNRSMQVSEEKPGFAFNGFIPIILFILAIIYAAYSAVYMFQVPGGFGFKVGWVPVILIGLFLLNSFYTLQPNEAMVLTFFGTYAGTDRTSGLRWTFPWFGQRKISLRVNNITSDKLKVNDKSGNPVEIAANVVWRVDDTAKALFDIVNYADFIKIQIDTGLREIASQYAYDSRQKDETTLLGNSALVTQRLKQELQTHLTLAGIIVDEARLTHLAYAPEIAGVMLRRQQAEAVLGARQVIVEGAVRMVEGALIQLTEDKIVELDAAQRATLVSNLLVILCAEREVSPILDAGASKR